MKGRVLLSKVDALSFSSIYDMGGNLVRCFFYHFSSIGEMKVSLFLRAVAKARR